MQEEIRLLAARNDDLMGVRINLEMQTSYWKHQHRKPDKQSLFAIDDALLCLYLRNISGHTTTSYRSLEVKW